MSDHQHVNDIMNGQAVPQRVVVEDEVLTGEYRGTVCVHGGATFTIGDRGELHGTLTVRPGSKVVIRGEEHGTLRVCGGAEVTISGEQHGTVHVEPNGRVSVEASGRLAGTLHNDGTVVNRGVRGGATSGRGAIEDVDGGTEKPGVVRNGIHYYEW